MQQLWGGKEEEVAALGRWGCSQGLLEHRLQRPFPHRGDPV